MSGKGFYQIVFLALCTLTARADLKKDFLLNLFDSGVILEGDYVWRNIASPLHVDMKSIISHPKLFDQAIKLVSNQLKQYPFDVICAVPWGPVPLAGALAAQLHVPMIMVRKMVEPNTMQKIIEGTYHQNQKVILIEDCAGSGMSVQETINVLEHNGLEVTDIVTLFDFEHGALEKFARQGKRVHSIATISDLIATLAANRAAHKNFIEKLKEFHEATCYCFR